MQGPDACCFPTDFGYTDAFLSNARHAARFQFSFHWYPNDFGNEKCTAEGMISEQGLLDEDLGIAYYQNIASGRGYDPHALVLSEFSAHNSGCNGVSDRFVHSLWFADFLGRASSMHGLHSVYRQSLFTGTSYGLVVTSEAAIDPNGHHEHLPTRSTIARVAPDYYTALLWRQLVGPKFLDFTGGTKRLRAYAACMPASSTLPTGSVTLLVVNLQNVTASLALSTERGIYTGRRAEYRLTAATGSLTDATMLLNGVALQPMSTLVPRIVDPGTNGTIALPGYSFMFVVLLEVTASACAARHQD